MAQTLVFSEPQTRDLMGIDDPRRAARLRLKKAEENLCVARHSLLQFVACLPVEAIKAYATAIEMERLKHLAHRQEDFEAELRALERQIQAVAPKLSPDQAALSAPSAVAELARLLAEVAHLKNLTPADLLASRDFSTGHVKCPACSKFLPLLPGLDAGKMSAIAGEIGRNNRIGAIALLRSATGLGLLHGKFYVDCPHVVPGVSAVQNPADGTAHFLCATCFYAFPTVGGITASTLSSVLELVAAGKTIAAIMAVRAATNWDLKEAKEYVMCPHRTP
jgi:ribosomal protein L7/L12